MQRTPPPAAMDGGSVWSISPEERGKHDKQFDTLAPVLGYVSGEQARGFFLQSGLPPSVLAEIWNLADMDGDGKMDRQEFSIAMKLIKMKLQGRSLPVALPMGLKQLPVAHAPHPSSARFGMGSLPNLSVGMPPPMSAMSILTPIPANTPLRPAPPMMMLPLTAGFPRCQLHFLSPAPLMAAGLPLSGFSSPLTFSPPGSRGMSQANSLVDLGSSSSSSSSTTSLASNSPKTTAGSSDWAVPQASRLKYRQQFNTLDKLMSGYLSGAQVRNALIASNLTQTQLATIWNLADVDKDGQLRADEFILAMHLVDTAKTGRPLPLTLPQDLIPPPLRGGLKCGELVNGTGPYSSPSLIDSLEIEPILKNKSSVSFEDKLKENFVRGSAELERRRQALEEQQRKERERRAREEREDRERREKEARESEQRRRLEEERRLERQRQVERQREEERLREMEKEAAKQELERQRQEQWERSRKEELSRTREGEHQELSQLRAKKKSLELELEAVGNKHKQISDRLRDAQSKRRIRKAEVELINQKRDARIVEINALQLQFEDWQKKFSLLVPEQQKLTEKLRHMNLNKILPVTLASLAANVSNKGVNCRKLKDQLGALQKETADKLAQMEQHNKELQELREKQAKQQSVLDDLRRVKEEKLRELKRRREEEEEERRRRMEEEERRRREEEEQRERRRKEEEERERRRKEEEERERRRKEEEEQERRRKEEEEARWAKLEQERIAREEARQWEEEERKKREQERIAREEARQWEEEERKKREEEKRKKAQEEAQAASRVTLYKALYSFAARNKDELSIDADGLIEVDEQTVGEPGWLCGSYRGNKGWFPHSYAEKCAEAGPSSLGQTSCPQLLPVSGVPDGELTGDNGALPLQSETSQLPAPVLTQVMARRSPTTSTTTSSQINLNLSSSEGEMSADTDPLDGIDSVQLEEYVALYTYESPEAGDLTFEEGDVVVVTEREGEWWRGCIGDQSGIFPSNYVRPVDPEVSRPGGPTKKPAEIAQAVTSSAAGAPTIYQLHLSPGQLIVVLAKNSTGWWLGELQVRGKKRQRGWIHSSHVKLLGPSSNKSSPSPLPVCQVIAMYEYTAANPDELSFSKGQLINVLDKTNPDWWKGEADGVTGLLPTNYVKMTTESDPSQQ